MYKTTDKKVKVSIFVIVTVFAIAMLIPNFSEFTYAATNEIGIDTLSNVEKENINDNAIDLEVVDEAIDNFENMKIDVKNIDVNTQGEIVLNTRVKNTDSTITIAVATNNKIMFDVVEGNKKDSVMIDDAGTVFLDGQEVKIDTVEENMEGNDAIDEVQANWQARYLSCPYGKASKYKYYAKRVTKRIKLAKDICKYTIVGLSSALIALLGTPLGAAGTAMAGGILADAVVGDGKVLKSVAKVYYHSKKKRFMVTSSIGCQKEATRFYGQSGRRLYSKTLWLYFHVNGA